MAKKFKFNEDHAKVILELGQQGASQKAMYAAIGISKDTAAKLKKEDPIFAETMSMATTSAQAFWECMLLANIDNKTFTVIEPVENIKMSFDIKILKHFRLSFFFKLN